MTRSLKAPPLVHARCMPSSGGLGAACGAREQIVEIVMDLGRPPLARFPGGDLRLSEQVVSPQDLQHAIDKVPRRCAS